MKHILLTLLGLILISSCQSEDDSVPFENDAFGIHVLGKFDTEHRNGRYYHSINGVEQTLPQELQSHLRQENSETFIATPSIHISSDGTLTYYVSDFYREGVDKVYRYTNGNKENLEQLAGCKLKSAITHGSTLPFGSCSTESSAREYEYRNFYITDSGEITFLNDLPKENDIYSLQKDNNGNIHTLSLSSTSYQYNYYVNGELIKSDSYKMQAIALGESGAEIHLSNEVLQTGNTRLPKTYLPENSVLKSIKTANNQVFEVGYLEGAKKNIEGSFYAHNGNVTELYDENQTFWMNNGIIKDSQSHIVGQMLSKHTGQWSSIYLIDGKWQPSSGIIGLSLTDILYVD